MDKTSVRLADGRELTYYGSSAGEAARYADARVIHPAGTATEARYDPLRDEWVLVAGHRAGRTHRLPDTECPLCPSAPGRLTEIPAPWYEVAVFQNRFPALTPAQLEISLDGSHDGDGSLLVSRPGAGRCEVVCFSPDHTASFADLSAAQACLVLEAWTDRTAVLCRLPGICQVYCFENRGREIGITLTHPHGQIYAYPFVTPRTSRMLATTRAYRARTGRNLFDDLLAAELADGSRVVARGGRWVAFVPHAARWPYEVHLYPLRRTRDLTGLTAAEREEFCVLYLDVLRRLYNLFGTHAPYISAWHQAPRAAGSEEIALHLELFTIRRAPDKLKYLAGTESGMDAFSNDIPPEAAARQLRELAAIPDGISTEVPEPPCACARPAGDRAVQRGSGVSRSTGCRASSAARASPGASGAASK
jgi:UDPglucose--hexose-1-phosphate uridylyltransferase